MPAICKEVIIVFSYFLLLIFPADVVVDREAGAKAPHVEMRRDASSSFIWAFSIYSYIVRAKEIMLYYLLG
jgi:hypothetical protein